MRTATPTTSRRLGRSGMRTTRAAETRKEPTTGRHPIRIARTPPDQPPSTMAMPTGARPAEASAGVAPNSFVRYRGSQRQRYTDLRFALIT
jgi:hypothetical protein